MINKCKRCGRFFNQLRTACPWCGCAKGNHTLEKGFYGRTVDGQSREHRRYDGFGASRPAKMICPYCFWVGHGQRCPMCAEDVIVLGHSQRPPRRSAGKKKWLQFLSEHCFEYQFPRYSDIAPGDWGRNYSFFIKKRRQPKESRGRTRRAGKHDAATKETSA